MRDRAGGVGEVGGEGKLVCFDRVGVRAGMPVERDFEVSESVESAWRRFPPAVLGQAELYWVTGMGVSAEHIRGLVRHTMGVEIPEEVMLCHFSRNCDRMVRERDEFMRRRHAKAMQEQLEVCTNPVDSRFQSIALSLSALLEGLVQKAMHGEVLDMDEVEALGRMAKTSREVARVDPSFMRQERGRDARQARALASETARGFAEGLGRVERWVGEGVCEEDDALVAEFEGHACRVLGEESEGGGSGV